MVTLIGPIIGHPYAYEAAEQGEQVSPVSCFPGLNTQFLRSSTSPTSP